MAFGALGSVPRSRGYGGHGRTGPPTLPQTWPSSSPWATYGTCEADAHTMTRIPAKTSRMTCKAKQQMNETGAEGPQCVLALGRNKRTDI